jgi:hypothetical protein
MSGTARRLLAGSFVSLLCGLAFAAYLDPDFAFTVANRVWACF